MTNTMTLIYQLLIIYNVHVTWYSIWCTCIFLKAHLFVKNDTVIFKSVSGLPVNNSVQSYMYFSRAMLTIVQVVTWKNSTVGYWLIDFYSMSFASMTKSFKGFLSFPWTQSSMTWIISIESVLLEYWKIKLGNFHSVGIGARG